MAETSKFRGAAGLWQNRWLACLLALIAIFVLVHLSNDYRNGFEFGWDVRVNCSAIEAYANGLDPYYVKNLKDTNLSYPYLPVTLDVFRPLCTGGFLVRHFREIYLAIAAVSALLLSSLPLSRWNAGDTFLKALYVFGGFAGFEWTFVTGNFAILTGLLTALALCLFYCGFSRQEDASQGEHSIACYMAAAIVFGLLVSIKLVFFPLLLSFYFFPLTRRWKIILILVASVCFALPGLISFLFYRDLFHSWLDAVSGRIPGQHSPASESCNPSVLCLGQALSENLGLIHPNFLGGLFYGIVVFLLILGPLATSVIRLVRQQYISAHESFLRKLDRLLLDNPQFAMRLAMLSMLALYLCVPRLKEYTYFEMAMYAAMLVADLPAIAIAAVCIGGIVVPALAIGSPAALVNTFGQTVAALFCFEVFLLDLRPCFFRLRTNGFAAISAGNDALSA